MEGNHQAGEEVAAEAGEERAEAQVREAGDRERCHHSEAGLAQRVEEELEPGRATAA